MPVIFYLKLTTNHLKPYYLRVSIKQLHRLQQILIRTFAYHFTVKYIPGVPVSWQIVCLNMVEKKDTIKLPMLNIHQITSQLNAKSDSLNQMRIATQEDNALALFKHTITHGWPSTITEVPSKIHSYFTFREELIIEDGIVLKATQIVVPHKKTSSYTSSHT